MDPTERRELILTAASRAFASRPYEEVSLAAIAQEAHASEALVHKYFTSKAGIYAQVLQRATNELAERTRQADDALPPNSSARDRVRTSILTYLDFIAERSPGWMAYQILAGHEPGEAAQVRQAARESAVEALADPSFSHSSELLAFVGVVGVEVVVHTVPAALERLGLISTALGVWFCREHGSPLALHVLGLGFLLFWVCGW